MYPGATAALRHRSLRKSTPQVKRRERLSAIAGQSPIAFATATGDRQPQLCNSEGEISLVILSEAKNLPPPSLPLCIGAGHAVRASAPKGEG
jgi:hypothetical protein